MDQAWRYRLRFNDIPSQRTDFKDRLGYNSATKKNWSVSDAEHQNTIDSKIK